MESPLSPSAERVNVVNDDQFKMTLLPKSRSARIQSGDCVHIAASFILILSRGTTPGARLTPPPM